ncbi:hypothetical protein [Winogradskyella sp. 4-2091]|uniref:hypothetical protein n=1 Tax=Winogradskyella sp. 4-2091 TaxID=3381659 RepID=UPI0038914A4E
MKNKTKTYILIAIVIAVWGTIGYKILNGVSPNLAEITQDEFDVSFNPKTNIEIDTFSIENIERDPFLGILRNKKNKTSTKLARLIKNEKDNSPLIVYSGLIRKQNSSGLVFIVNVNKNQYLLKKGQSADSVKLIKGNEKEITIRYRSKNKTIKRQ